MALLLPDTLEAMVTTLASVKLKLMLDISVDTMVDLATVDTMAGMLAIVDSLDKLLNIRANKELFPYDKIHTFYFDLNKLDTMADMLAIVDTLDKLLNIRANK